jgi:hypothetical protein
VITPAGVRRAAAALGAAAVLAAAAPAAGSGRAPVVDHMVVFRSGEAIVRHVSTRSVRVRVGRKRCVVGSGLPLAALARARPGRIRLRDFGSCGRRARDSGDLFVTGIGPDRNRGQRGWVYKVGRKAATAGAANPTGPFGRGRLRSGQRVVWFYCLKASSCQRTLVVRARVRAGGAVTVRVVGYDDEGRGVDVAGATVRLGRASVTSGVDGLAFFRVPPGRYRLFASKRRLVRSFPELVVVR